MLTIDQLSGVVPDNDRIGYVGRWLANTEEQVRDLSALNGHFLSGFNHTEASSAVDHVDHEVDTINTLEELGQAEQELIEKLDAIGYHDDQPLFDAEVDCESEAKILDLLLWEAVQVEGNESRRELHERLEAFNRNREVTVKLNI